MGPKQPNIFTKNINISQRIILYVLATIFMGNLHALADFFLHPEISYFDQSHFIIGTMMSLLTIIICGLLEGQKSSSGSMLKLKMVHYTWLFALFWTIGLGSSLLWNIMQQKQEVQEVAKNEARTIYEKDLIYYLWATKHNGVYVPITNETQPNPYLIDLLQSQEHEAATSSGKSMTLINPEYMIRQVYEMQAPHSKIYGHITSLDPLRPENEADEWETLALEKFEQGVEEVSSVEVMDGQPYLRLMRPMITGSECLQCHVQQGYDVEDIRGGISVSVPMTLLLSLYKKDVLMLSLAHITVWILGIMGIFLGSHSINESIVEREHAEAKTRSIIENMLDGLITMDEQCTIESMNSAACKIFQYDSAELAGKRIDLLLRIPKNNEKSPESQHSLYKDLRTVLGSPEEVTGIRKGGEHFPMEISLSEMDSKAERVLIATIRDITEEKARKNEALRSGQLAAIGELAAGVAHEINNPINGIINYSQLLLDDAENEAEQDKERINITQRIIKESERIALIVRNLLTFARQRDELAEEIKLVDVINDSISLLMHQFNRDEIILEVQVDNDLPFLKGNPQQLQQVFVNLLTNASYALNQKFPKSSPDKRLQIKSILIQETDKKFIRTTVSDWGAGIAQDIIDHIFDSLFTTKPPGKGTGLGLNISKGLIRDHQGSLRIDSQPGGPTVATVDIPTNETLSS